MKKLTIKDVVAAENRITGLKRARDEISREIYLERQKIYNYRKQVKRQIKKV
jgi:hypothetical protein